MPALYEEPHCTDYLDVNAKVKSCIVYQALQCTLMKSEFSSLITNEVVKNDTVYLTVCRKMCYM